tara:strand:+ start:569 stop:697 length:129 start_codon:yes stop_codon:yes gene_type:complete
MVNALTTAQQKKLKELLLKQQQWLKEKELIQRAKAKTKKKNV